MNKDELIKLGFKTNLDSLERVWNNSIKDNYEIIDNYILYSLWRGGRISGTNIKAIVIDDDIKEKMIEESRKLLPKRLDLYKCNCEFITKSEKRASDNLGIKRKNAIVEEEFRDVGFETFMINKKEEGKELINIYNLDIKNNNIGKVLPEAYLYQIIVDNEVVYVGKTTRSLKERITEHIMCVLDSSIINSQQNYLYKAMRECKGYKFEVALHIKNKIDNFQLESLEKELIERIKPKYNYQGVKVPYQFGKNTNKEVENKIKKIEGMIKNNEITEEEAWSYLWK